MFTVSMVQAALLLQKSTVGVIPCDTVYGIVARAEDEMATGRLYALKKRERKPGTLIAASIAQLVALGFDSAILGRLANLWPAPLSVVIPSSPARPYLDQSVGSQAVRLPDNNELRTLLLQTGPLITSSANQPGKPPAETIEEAYGYFQDHVDFYVDGGSTHGRAPSTIIRINNGGIMEVLREGAVKIQAQEL